MSRLIEADRLDKDLRMYAERKAAGGHIEIANGVLSAAERIKQYAPTVDAVPVVRCCDCRHFRYNLTLDGYLPDGVAEAECTLFHVGMDYTGFCSYGERGE